MGNILNFKKPPQKKKNDPLTIKIIIAVLLLLAVIKLPQIINGVPPLYREHSVNILNAPIELPEGFLVSDLNGVRFPLSDEISNNITVLAFWATWCKYCAKEFPIMDSDAQYLANNGIKIIPIAKNDDTPEKIRNFFERGNIKNIESVIATSSDLHEQLGVRGYPSYMAVDKNGMVFATLRPEWGSGNILELFRKLGERANNTELP